MILKVVILGLLGMSASATKLLSNRSPASSNNIFFMFVYRLAWHRPYSDNRACLLGSAVSAFPIHWQCCTIDCPGGIGYEERDYLRNRRRLDPLAEITVRNGGAILRGVNRARHDAIDVDVRRLQLGSQGFRQSQHGTFRCAVSGVSCAARQAVPAGDVDDFAASLFQHLRND